MAPHSSRWGFFLLVETVGIKIRVMVFNNISVISWWSVLLVEETGVLEENHRPATTH